MNKIFSRTFKTSDGRTFPVCIKYNSLWRGFQYDVGANLYKKAKVRFDSPKVAVYRSRLTLLNKPESMLYYNKKQVNHAFTQIAVYHCSGD